MCSSINVYWASYSPLQSLILQSNESPPSFKHKKYWDVSSFEKVITLLRAPAFTCQLISLHDSWGHYGSGRWEAAARGRRDKYKCYVLVIYMQLRLFMYIWMHVCTYERTYIYICRYVCQCLYLRKRECVYRYRCVYWYNVYIDIDICYIQVCMYINKNLGIYVFIRAFMCKGFIMSRMSSQKEMTITSETLETITSKRPIAGTKFLNKNNFRVRFL